MTEVTGPAVVDLESLEALEALEDFVIASINDMTRQAVERLNEHSKAGDLLVHVPMVVPLPDGSSVAADEATPEQWKQSTDWLVGATAKDCAQQLQAAINLMVAYGFYCTPRPVMQRR